MKVKAARAQERARELLPHVRLHDIRVVRLDAVGSHPVLDGPFAVDWSLQVKAEPRDGHVDCRSEYIVAADAEGSRAWSIEVDLVGEWRVDAGAPDFDQEHLGCFAYAVGMAALHPYAREVVQSTVSRMGYPPFTLEMIMSPALGDPEATIDLGDHPDESIRH